MRSATAGASQKSVVLAVNMPADMTKKSHRKRKRTAAPSPASRIKKFLSATRRWPFWLGLASSAGLSVQMTSCSLSPEELAAHLPQSAQPALATLHTLATGLSRFALQDLLGLDFPTHTAPTPHASTATRFSQCREHFPAGKPPVVPQASGLRELCYSGFAVLHSASSKTPVFVAERLNRASLQQARKQQRTDRFFADARLPRAERAELADYQGSGYSRGHMAPAANMASAEAMAQSFSLANMVPQNQTHNAGPWSRIEQDTRKYVQHAQGDVYVFTGPVFAGPLRTIGPGKVHVPSHLFKLVYDTRTGKRWAHWQANAANARVSTPISYEELVRRSGIEFLPG